MEEGSAGGTPGRAELPVFVEPADVSLQEVPATERRSPSERGAAAKSARVAERGQTWTDYENADGSRARRMSTDVINYKTPVGEWAEVDNSLVDDGAGGLVNKANSWQVRFPASGAEGIQIGSRTDRSGADQAKRGSGAATGVRVAPLGGAKVAPKVSGSEVTYPGLWPSVDATYTVTGSMVKEVLVLKDRKAAHEFRFAVSSLSDAAVAASPAPGGSATAKASPAPETGRATPGAAPSGSASAGAEVAESVAPSAAPSSGAAARAGLKKAADGVVVATAADGSQVAFEPPVVVRADGAPVAAAGAKFAVEADGSLALSVDQKWLASQPDSAFPILLDPTVRPETGPWYTHAFRSDGPHVTGQGVKIGNSRDGGDRHWRSMARYDWTNMAYAKIVDSYFHVTKVSGASYDTPISVYWSSAESYAGAVSGPVLASGSMSNPYFGDQTWVDSLQSWANQGGFPWPGFAGGETPGVYTFQTLIVDLWVEYNRPPTAPERVWPGDGASLHRLTLPLEVTGSTDVDGDPITYRFEASLVSDDGVRVDLDRGSGWESTPWYSDWTAHPLQDSVQWSAARSLTAGEPVKIKIEFYNYTGPAILQVYIKDPSDNVQVLPASWLTPGLDVLPTGWGISLPGGGNSYTRATPGYQSVVLTDASGQGHTYLQTGDGGYTPPPGEAGTLTGTVALGWTLTDGDGSVYTFNPAGQPTSARSALDATRPAAAVYTYDTTVSPARVSTITDPVSERDIHLTYGPSTECAATTTPAVWDAAPANQLCKVSYWDGTATRLHYLNGQLAAVEEPGDAITQFGYTDGLVSSVRGVLANDLILAGKIADTPAAMTQIDYAWLTAASTSEQDNIRPDYATVSKDGNGHYPHGAIPVVTAVTGPSPDAGSAPRPQHSYTYTGASTTAVTVAGIPGAASTVTYDQTGRVLTSQTAANPAAATTWDSDGKDLTRSVTDPAGRMTTTIYDWADRVTDTFGPAPAACFDADGFPVASPPPGCGVIPHTHTGFDTDTNGARLTGLSVDQYTNLDLTGQPASRATAGLDPAGWANKDAGVSTRLTGEIALPVGDHTFSAELANTTDDGIRVYVDDKPVVDRWWTLRQAVKADQPVYYWTGAGLASDTGVGQAATWGNQNVTFGGPSVGTVDATATSVYTGNAALDNNGLFTNANITSPTIELWFKTTGTGVLVGQDNNTAHIGLRD